MRRLISGLLSAMTMLALTAGLALAAVTWHSGPTFTQNGTGASSTFTATGDGSGLGNQPAVATIVLSATVRYTCVNKGGNAAAGQNPVPASTTGSQDLGNADHNGRGVLNLTVGPITAAATVGGKVAARTATGRGLIRSSRGPGPLP